MKYILTKGGTTEKIDDVRGITNFASGRLGDFVEHEFSNSFKNGDVSGTIIDCKGRDADWLISALQTAPNDANVIIHSAAVSDYRVFHTVDGKIDSSSDELVIKLKKTPKIIKSLREWFPDSKIIGFKLTSGVEEEALLEKARELLKYCDYVLANRLEDISGDSHAAMLINSEGVLKVFQTKQEIAKGLVELCMSF